MFKLPSPLLRIHDPHFDNAGVAFYIKRDDLIHPQISGNKWRKLKYNLQDAQKLQKNTILTFGGAFSNHIYATAAAGKAIGLKTIGIIRGEKTLPLNGTLSFAESQGMKLYFLSRTDYRNKETKEVMDKLRNMVQEDFFLIPEGGANEAGVKGCSEIVEEIDINFDYLCSPCGTGTTFKGLAQRLKSHQKALGFLALKVSEESFMSIGENQTLLYDYHFGGYAKTTPELIHFIKTFENTHHVLLEQVYTGKMMFGLYDLLSQGFFKRGETIIALHTGGLQGRADILK